MVSSPVFREGVEPSRRPGLSRPRMPFRHLNIGVTGGSRTHTPSRAQVLSLLRMPFRHGDVVSTRGVEPREPLRARLLRPLRLPIFATWTWVRGVRIELTLSG